MTTKLNGLQLGVLRHFVGTDNKAKPAKLAGTVPNAHSATIDFLERRNLIAVAVWDRRTASTSYRITLAGLNALERHNAATAPKPATEGAKLAQVAGRGERVPTIANGNWYPSPFVVFAEWPDGPGRPMHRTQLYSNHTGIRIETYADAEKIVRNHRANWVGDEPSYAIFEGSYSVRSVPAPGAPIHRNGNPKNPNLRKA